MTPVELQRYRALRDQRFSRAWWAFFWLGCVGVVVSALHPKDWNGLPWLILGGLACMIFGRRHHAKRVGQADALADEQAAEAVLVWEAKRAAELQVNPGQDDRHGPRAP